MPVNTPLPTVSTGGVIAATATERHSRAQYGGRSVRGAGSDPGGHPPVTAPNFQIQAATLGFTFMGGASGTIGLPATFPNGVLAASATPLLGSGVVISIGVLSLSTSQIALTAADSSGAHTGALNVSLIIIGF
jgi:hypothetical protein